MEAHGSVLGIDVGWSTKRRSSAVCRLHWSCSEVAWEFGRFRATDEERKKAIQQVDANHELMAVAIDGPLRRGFAEIGRYRSAERLLSRGELSKRIGKPGQSSSPNGRKLNEQASRSAELVKKLCRIRTATHRPRIDSYAIVEAFPTTFLGVMIDRPEMLHRPRQRSDRYFAHLTNGQHLDQCLAGLLPYRQPALPTRGVGNHDERASLVCALTALYVAAGSFGAVGDCNDGWIILPPRHQFAHCPLCQHD